MRTRTILIGALLLLVMLAGCTGTPDADDTGSKDEAPEASTDLEAVAPPGIYQLPDGNSQALGILTYRDIEGGFWAVVATAVPEEAADAEVVAVVVASEQLEVDLQTMNGEYVSVVGTRSDDPSIYLSGPVIQAQSAEVIAPADGA